MPAGFDWQTDDETWEANIAGQQSTPGRRRPPWRAVLFVAVTLAIAGGFIYWFVQQRIEDASDAAEGSVLAAHRLIRQADKQADEELFRSTLAMENTPWARQQERLVATKSRFNRLAFGLQDVSLEEGDGSDVTVALSPELNGAEVAFALPYVVERADGREQRLLLRQTAHYTREIDRWLLTPPSPDYWGEWRTFDGQILEVTYRQGDALFAERLAPDLDTFAVELCQSLPNVHCPAGLRLPLRFDDELAPAETPEYLASLSFPGESLRLPTPVLVGLPVDEASYQILLESYARFVAAAVIRDSAGYQCCRYDRLYKALLELQLHQLGLRPRPITARQYASLAGDAIHLRGLAAVLSGEGGQPAAGVTPPYYALAEFLVVDQKLAAAEVQRELVNSRIAPPREVFDRLTDGRFGFDNELELAWMDFLEANAAPTSASEPVSPDEDLQLACVPVEGGQTELLRYDPATALLEHDRTLEVGYALLLGLPDKSGFVVAGLPGPEAGQIFLSRNGVDLPLLQSGDEIIPVSFQEAAGGDESLLIVFNARQRQYGTLAIDACLSGGACEITPLPGYPLLSPDGSRPLFLIAAGNSGYEARFVRPFVLDSVAGEIISTGKAPLWLDSNTVGFIRPAAEAAVAFDVNESSALILFSTADVVQAGPWPEEMDPRTLEIEHLAPHPAGGDKLLVVVADAARGSHFFVYDLNSGELSYQDSADIFLKEAVVYDFRYSPDGRWLVISGLDYTEGRTTLYFYDVASGELYQSEYLSSYPMRMHWSYDWSSDGRWLSIPDSGYVRLINPAAGNQELYIPESGYCTSAVWLAANN